MTEKPFFPPHQPDRMRFQPFLIVIVHCESHSRRVPREAQMAQYRRAFAPNSRDWVPGYSQRIHQPEVGGVGFATQFRRAGSIPDTSNATG